MLVKLTPRVDFIYRFYHRFGPAKFPDDGSILGSFFNSAPAASKNITL